MIRKTILIKHKPRAAYARDIRKPILNAISQGSIRPILHVRKNAAMAKKENADLASYYIPEMLRAAKQKNNQEAIIKITTRTFRRLKPDNKYLNRILKSGFYFARQYPQTLFAVNAFFEKNITNPSLISHIDEYIDFNLDAAYKLFQESESFENILEIKEILINLNNSIKHVNIEDCTNKPYKRLISKRKKIIGHLAATIKMIDASESSAQLKAVNIRDRVAFLTNIQTNTSRSERLSWLFYNYRKRHFWSWKNAIITSTLPNIALAPVYFLAVSSSNLTMASFGKVAAVYFPLLAMNALLGATSSIIGQSIKKGIKNIRPDMINPAKLMAYAQYNMIGTTIGATFDFLTILAAKQLSFGSPAGKYSIPVLVSIALASRVIRDPFFLITLKKHAFINKDTIEGKFNLKKHMRESYKETFNLMKPSKYIEAIKGNWWLPIYYGTVSSLCLLFLPATIIPTVGILCSVPINAYLAYKESK